MLTREDIVRTLEKCEEIHLGAWGLLALEYIKDKTPIQAEIMSLEGTLLQVAKAREERAKEYMYEMREQLKKKYLKNQPETYMERVQALAQIEQQAWEMTLNDVLCPQLKSDGKYYKEIMTKK